MPTRVYKCDNCEGKFEKMEKLTSELQKICPKCGGKLRIVFFPVPHWFTNAKNEER